MMKKRRVVSGFTIAASNWTKSIEARRNAIVPAERQVDWPRKTLDEGLLMLRVEELEEEITETNAEICRLVQRLNGIESLAMSSTYIHTLADDRVSVRKPIPVTVRLDGDEFVASFLEANISISGVTALNAISGLQSLLADIACDLPSRPDETLGKSMRKQKRVLAEFICLT